jgi:hypothetical protein
VKVENCSGKRSDTCLGTVSPTIYRSHYSSIIHPWQRLGNYNAVLGFTICLANQMERISPVIHISKTDFPFSLGFVFVFVVVRPVDE